MERKGNPQPWLFFYDIVGIQSRKLVFISKKHDWRIKVMQYMIILIWCGCDNIECYQISILLVNSEREKGHWLLHGLPSSPIIVFSVDDSWLLKLPDFFSFSGCFICLNKLHPLYTSWAYELIKYGLATNHGAVANVLLKFQLDIQTDYLNKKLKQTTIDKFCNQV